MKNPKIHMLKATHGDAFILECSKGGQSGMVVVDGGAHANRKFNEFIDAVEDCDKIDLMVLTHPDDDHITGILNYIRIHKDNDPFPVKEIWANCATHVPYSTGGDLSPRQGATLADMLEKISHRKGLEWNSRITAGIHFQYPFADIDVLTPSEESLNNFLDKYRGKLSDYHGTVAITDASPKSDSDYKTDMKTLADRPWKAPSDRTYAKAANIASISFVLRCDDFSILMAGDSFPNYLCDSLRNMGYSEDNPLEVDYLKVAHHGSAPNMNNELLGLIRCDKFLISTNGGKGSARHPERETIARILCHPRRDYARTVHLYFNYAKEKIERGTPRLFNPDIDNFEQLNCIIHYGDQ